MNITTELLPIDQISQSGRIYPEKVVHDILHQFETKDTPLLGVLRQSGRLHPLDTKVDLSQVSHKITELSIKDNKLMASIEVLDTPMGQILQSIITSGGNISFGASGIGKIKGNVISDYNLISVDILNTNQSAPDVIDIIQDMVTDGAM